MNGVKGRSRHEHQWVEMRRTFTGDGSVKSITGADPETIERLLFGVTSVEMMCSECGDRKSYELLGDASWPMRSCRGCVVNGDHLLHLRGVEDGRTYWRLTCHHEPGVYGATMDDEQRTPDPEWPADVCVIADWWEAIGDDMLGIKGDVETLPLPVRPEWEAWDAVTLVRDDMDGDE